MIVDTDAPATHEAFAALVGISRPLVTDLVGQGVLEDGAPVGQWLLVYTARLREQAAGRSAAQANERARFERLKADHQAMVNAQKRRELVPTDLLEQILADIGRRIVVVLEALPVRVRRELPNAEPATIALMQDEVLRARAEAAALEFPAELVDEYLRRAGAPEAGTERAVGAASTAAAPAVAMG